MIRIGGADQGKRTIQGNCRRRCMAAEPRGRQTHAARCRYEPAGISARPWPPRAARRTAAPRHFWIPSLLGGRSATQQCYLVAPFALVMSIGGSMILVGTNAELPGACMILAAALWFWCVQIVWFRHRMRIALWRSAVAATITLLIGAGINLGVGHALSHVKSGEAAPVAEPNTKARSSE